MPTVGGEPREPPWLPCFAADRIECASPCIPVSGLSAPRGRKATVFGSRWGLRSPWFSRGPWFSRAAGRSLFMFLRVSKLETTSLIGQGSRPKQTTMVPLRPRGLVWNPPVGDEAGPAITGPSLLRGQLPPTGAVCGSGTAHSPPTSVASIKALSRGCSKALTGRMLCENARFFACRQLNCNGPAGFNGVGFLP